MAGRSLLPYARERGMDERPTGLGGGQGRRPPVSFGPGERERRRPGDGRGRRRDPDAERFRQGRCGAGVGRRRHRRRARRDDLPQGPAQHRRRLCDRQRGVLRTLPGVDRARHGGVGPRSGLRCRRARGCPRRRRREAGRDTGRLRLDGRACRSRPRAARATTSSPAASLLPTTAATWWRPPITWRRRASATTGLKDVMRAAGGSLDDIVDMICFNHDARGMGRRR